jgi:hypothetical protein
MQLVSADKSQMKILADALDADVLDAIIVNTRQSKSLTIVQRLSHFKPCSAYRWVLRFSFPTKSGGQVKSVHWTATLLRRRALAFRRERDGCVFADRS